MSYSQQVKSLKITSPAAIEDADGTMDILGVKINTTNLSVACQVIETWVRTQSRTYVCIAPVATIVDCQEDEEYQDIVNNAGMTTPDGMPLVWLGRLKGKRLIERTYGPDLMLRLCQLSENNGYKHYFYGGSRKTNELLVKNLKTMFPNLNVAGHFSPPLRRVNEPEDDAVLEEINRAQPDILWVGLGSPKQDYWMSRHRARLNVPVMVGTGAAFDFIAGTKAQAPRWMRNAGLEWLFRLCCEPRRLWKRYLVGNSKFVLMLVKDFFRDKRQ